MSAYTYVMDERLTQGWDPDAHVSVPWDEVGSADTYPDLSYEFDEVRVFRHRVTGALVIAHDSGCSCPEPFDGTRLKDAVFIDRLKDFDDFVAKHEELETSGYDEDSGEYVTYDPPRHHPRILDGIAALRRQVENLLLSRGLS